MAYIIGSILFVIVLLIIGLIFRKRIYDAVDKQENWKLDIMSRNIASQLSRIKALNLSGETQDRFEIWKERWEDIVAKELPDLEEHLLDAEEAADKFLFPKAKRVLADGEKVLKTIEKDLEEMLNGLEELLESEEISRKEVEELEPSIKKLRKKLSQNRYLYGKAELQFDVALDELEEAFGEYHELVNKGNYFEAKELVIQIKQDKEEIEDLIENFPSILKKCKYDVPGHLDNLLAGIKEMKEDGYRVEHLGFEKDIHTYQEKLKELLLLLEKGKTKETVQFLAEMDERINEMYQLLEKEAIAKNYLETRVPSFQHSLDIMNDKYEKAQSEVEELRHAYFFEDSDMEKYMSLGNSISMLEDKINEISMDMDDRGISHAELRDRLEIGYQKLEELDKDLEEFKESIQNLRKDELEARDKLAEMRRQLYNLNRKLKKSNIPGVPTYIWNSMEETAIKNSKVIAALEKTPLEMVAVNEALLESKVALDETMEQTDLMLEQAYLTEQVIQYANRYRSKYPLLAAKLAEAERLFRLYEYELALETAAKTLEEIEPGALNRIEEAQATIHS
ncbi:septation ring formation regulator EzrA [Oceanobacillus senegalensis]|uniref:septation ring formation regulator EzrA n=1 Tax=Oceanobacillus senegalensis TaxID=1936063 RepID=UPI000A30FE90|nr:septation ring formation regulator EzrA [Oceanobacillus senegalensis]